jgi:hypothetical protein
LFRVFHQPTYLRRGWHYSRNEPDTVSYRASSVTNQSPMSALIELRLELGQDQVQPLIARDHHNLYVLGKPVEQDVLGDFRRK